jgi:molybdopterin converting factor small subunit
MTGPELARYPPLVPVVTLRPPLRDLAGGQREVNLEGGTIGEALRDLERRHPAISGWILDEHGRVRRHVSVFLDGERVAEDAPVRPADVVHVLPAISGGSNG